MLIVVLCIPNFAHAGPWLQKEGEGEVNLNYSFFYSDKSYDNNGKKVAATAFVKHEFNPYFEYGVDDDLTIGGALSFQALTNDGSTILNPASVQKFDELQLSYFDIFARTPIFEGEEYIFSLQPGFRYPINSDASINPEGSDIIPEIKILGGYGFKLFDQYSYVDGSANYRYRDINDLKDMLKLEGTIGLKLHKNYLLIGQAFYEKSLNRQRADMRSGNYDATKLQLSLAYDYWETVFMQAGYYKTIDGVNTSYGDGVIFSIWYKF